MSRVQHIHIPDENTATYYLCCDATVKGSMVVAGVRYSGKCGKPASNVAVYHNNKGTSSIEVLYCNRHYKEVFN